MSAPSASLREPQLSSLLAVASLTFWFALAFPWQHHNESLVWAVDLQHDSFLGSLLPHAVRQVSTYRPLGIGLAWLTFHVTDDGLWLQQLINYAFTVCAWLVAMQGVRDTRSFAWLAFFCGTCFFSGYIYLFHLHGVFYGPLLLFLAWLLRVDTRFGELTWRSVGPALSLALITSLFHTFALVFFLAFLLGRVAENWLKGEQVGLVPAAVAAAVSLVAMKLLMHGAQGVAPTYALQGFFDSYYALELNWGVKLASIALTALGAASIAVGAARTQGSPLPKPHTGPPPEPGVRPALRRPRLADSWWLAIAGVVGGLILAFLHVPVVLGWLGVCCVKAVLRGRLCLATLTAACTLLPLATGTGSPTYAVFAVMPAIVTTVTDLAAPAVWRALEPRLAPAALVVTAALLIILRLDPGLPPFARALRPLLAEREKTTQLMQMMVWLDANPDVRGGLRLCLPADWPVRSGASAFDRRYRAPTDAVSFAYYLRSRYGDRFTGEPQLLFCFGGEKTPKSTVLHVVPGDWAGSASLERL